ncbi:MAG TPA: hypothetical protein VNN08_18760 [Thermoanaerobaculia bacterium]|nr:hypothetical protein [Thermoanaerobaculia bacterium]
MPDQSDDAGVAASCREKGRDVWIRSRTNAFAHKLEARRLTIIANAAFASQTLFIVVPIVCVSLTLLLNTAGRLPAGRLIAWVATWSVADLSVIAILSNGLALYLSIVTNRFQWSERSQRHRELLSGFQLLAQKARRLDTSNLRVDEAVHLLRHLEETFEIYKAWGLEPGNSTFGRAQRMMLKLTTYPFGIKATDLVPPTEASFRIASA